MIECFAYEMEEYAGEGAMIMQSLAIAPKPGGIAGGGKTGPKTSYGSRYLRKLTGERRVPKPFASPTKKIFGTTSIGGAISKSLGFLGAVGGVYTTGQALSCVAKCPPLEE